MPAADLQHPPLPASLAGRVLERGQGRHCRRGAAKRVDRQRDQPFRSLVQSVAHDLCREGRSELEGYATCRLATAPLELLLERDRLLAGLEVER